MGSIYKGKIAAIEGNSARVMPSEANTKPTTKITIPWYLRGNYGNLKKGTSVVYVEFNDGTGLLLNRADGECGAHFSVESVNHSDIENSRKSTSDSQ